MPTTETLANATPTAKNAEITASHSRATRRRPDSRKHIAGYKRRTRWTFFTVAAIITLVTLFPLVWMFTSSFKPADEVLSTNILPHHPTLGNFKFVFSSTPFWRYLFNTAFVAIVVTVLALLFHSMAAYALGRLHFPGREKVFLAIFSTLLVTGPVVLVPLFLIVDKLGILNSYAGLILPAIFSAYGIFLLRQFYISLPGEIEEAAILDGCSYWRLFRSIMLPLSKPVLSALAVLFFLANWNAYLWPLVSTNDQSLQMVQTGIASFRDQNGADWNYILAAATLAAIPTLVAFAIFQRKIVESIKTSGMK